MLVNLTKLCAQMCCRHGDSQLARAAKAGTSATAALLLALGADIKRTNHAGDTALSVAAMHGHTEIVKRFLKGSVAAMAIVPSVNVLGRTPLALAAAGGHTSTVQLLATTGHANVDCTDSDGNTPLIAAATHGHVQVVRVLLNTGAAVNHINLRGDTALLVVAHEGQCLSP